MMNVIFANSYWAPLLVFITSFILVYVGLVKLKTDAAPVVLSILSAIISIMLVSSTSSVTFIFTLIPYLTTIMTILFAITLVTVFVAKDVDQIFNKGLAWTGLAIAVIVALWLAFNYFPTLGHMLPQSSNSGLGSNAIEFKNWFYSNEIKDTLVLFLCVGLVGFFLVKKK
jgi:hypothetical protein